MNISWVWLLLGLALSGWGLQGSLAGWQASGFWLGLLVIVFDTLAVRLPFGFFSCSPGLLAAMALAKGSGPPQAWLALMLALALRSALHGPKSLPSTGCDLLSRGLGLACLALTRISLGQVALVPAGLVYLVSWRVIASSIVEAQLPRSQRSAWGRVQNWTAQHQIAVLFLAPLLILVVDAEPLYCLLTLPLLGGLYRAVYAEMLRLQVYDAEELQKAEQTSRRKLEEVSSTLQQTQQSLHLKALGESVLWELGQQLFNSKRIDNTARLALNYLLSKVKCDSAAVVMVEEGRPVIKAAHPDLGTVRLTSLFETSFREQRPIFTESGEMNTPVTRHPFAIVLPLGSEGVLYCGRANLPLASPDKLRGGYTAEEWTLIGNIAGQVSLGLQSARLFEEQQRTLASLLQSAKIAAVGQLAAGLAHELNSPLAAIALQMDLAGQRLGRPEQARGNLEAAHRSVDQAQQILKRLLFYSRDGAVDGQQVDLNRILEDTLSFMAGALAEQQIQVSCQLQPVAPLQANPSELQQVILSLLLNAREAVLSPQAHGKAITLATAMAPPAEGRNLRHILVRDEGPGIPEEILERIFEPFFTTRPVGQGAGLGLSIALQIVQGYGGRLTARNRVDGRGAEFLVEL